jgi:GT2 family glycosyltransferase
MTAPPGKVGIGVITCNREDLFRRCIASLPNVDTVVVVNDGRPYPPDAYPSYVARVIQHPRNRGVARSKNDALRFLMDAGCVHLFVCEDDIRVLDEAVCQEYIRASFRSGILHFNFGNVGYENRTPEGGLIPPRKVVGYGDGVTVALFRHLHGVFQYFRREALEKCGLFDTLFHNMLEHTDLTFRMIHEGYHPPYWWFADIGESVRYLEDLDPGHARSTSTRSRFVYRLRFHFYDRYFSWRHGWRAGLVPDTDERAVEEVLANIQRLHGEREQL